MNIAERAPLGQHLWAFSSEDLSRVTRSVLFANPQWVCLSNISPFSPWTPVIFFFKSTSIFGEKFHATTSCWGEKNKQTSPCINFVPGSFPHHITALDFVLDEINSTFVYSAPYFINLCYLRTKSSPSLLSHSSRRSRSTDTYVLRTGFLHPPVSFRLFGFCSQLSRCITSFVMWWAPANPALLVSRRALIRSSQKYVSFISG